MSEKTQPPVINFVRIKQWYVPADADSYQLLKSVGVPMVRVHGDFLPTLQLVTKPRGIRAKARYFSEVYAEKMDALGAKWMSKPDRKCKISDSRAVFTAKLTPRNRIKINEIDDFFTRFTARWGFSYKPVYSESDKQLKLVVDIKFDPTKNPVIPSMVPPEQVVHELELGFSKIKVTFNNRRSAPQFGDRTNSDRGNHPLGAPYSLLEVFVKAGCDWQLVHTGTFIAETVGNMQSFLQALAVIHTSQKAVSHE